MAGAMVDQQPLRGCVAQVLPGRVGRECRRPRSRGQRECWRTVGSRTSALTPRIFGTNRGTWGFNPVWTACDMIMKSKSELEALVLAHAAICSISTRMIDSSSALSHASRFSNSRAEQEFPCLRHKSTRFRQSDGRRTWQQSSPRRIRGRSTSSTETQR